MKITTDGAPSNRTMVCTIAVEHENENDSDKYKVVIHFSNLVISYAHGLTLDEAQKEMKSLGASEEIIPSIWEQLKALGVSK